MKKLIALFTTTALLTTSLNAFSLFGSSVDEATIEMQIVQQVELGLQTAELTIQTAQDKLQTAEAIKHTTELVEQTKQLITQTKKATKQLIASTGIRSILSFPEEMKDLHMFLKEYSLDFMDLSDDIINKPHSIVGKAAKKLFKKYELFNDCEYEYMSKDEKRICKSRMIKNVQEIATYQETTKTLKSMSGKIKILAGKALASKDVKMSADIANSIQIKIAQLQMIKTQIDMMESQNRATERVSQRQKEQLYNKYRGINGMDR